MQTWQKQQRQTSTPRPRVPHFLLEPKIKDKIIILTINFFSYKFFKFPVSQEEYCLEKCFAFFFVFFSLSLSLLMHKSPKWQRTRGCWWVFSWHLSGFCLWGVKKKEEEEEEEGRAMGTYTYVVNEVEISFPCEPVSLSCRVFLLIVQLSSLDNLTFSSLLFFNIYIKHLKLHLWCMKCPKSGSNCSFTKAAKRSNKIHLGEICSKQSLNLNLLDFALELML